jgi:hypothetical protein
LDSLLATSGWRPIQQAKGDGSPNLTATVKARHECYLAIEGSPGWADYMSHLRTLREATARDLEVGTIDKWGRGHDDEKRAMLYFIDILLTYVPAIHREYDFIIGKEDEMARRREEKSLYGDDTLMHTPMTY